jgi:alkylation response protein AidB-like acyl-CoA dehydrogenase
LALSPAAESLRAEVRKFLDQELAAGTFMPQSDSWQAGHSPAFSRKLGERGWIGMTFPKEHGGQGRSYVDRYIVVEELLAAGAPVAAHWIADRQTGPLLLRHGTEEQKQRFLPAIARGESYFVIGMSEPDSGSDLASVRTRARQGPDGWILNGTKIWTSHAHLAHMMIALVRTAPVEADRHLGLSQFIVDLATKGVTIRPIRLLTGEEHFNEVVLEDVFVPSEMLVGEEGSGWRQVTSELAFERSGPERILSTFRLLIETVRERALSNGELSEVMIGELVARLIALRALSMAVAEKLDSGESPEVEAALIKDLGTTFERDVIEVARTLVDPGTASDEFGRLYRQALAHSPGFTLRGGTTEILRGIVARSLR